ncbi:hypothetical protein GCM10010282_10910 [Streptomyces roseolus]|nr:hypothetical protein GCM10010282_10910 [Streptomyces roseolus]
MTSDADELDRVVALLARLSTEERDRVVRVLDGPSRREPSASAKRFVPLPTRAGASSVVVRTRVVGP